MAEHVLIEALEQIIMAGVAVTTVALAKAQPGVEFTFTQWRVLVVLGNAGSGITMTQVAERIGVTLPATTRQLRRLAARGFVLLEPDARDRRAIRVRLSESGKAARQSIMAYRRAKIARAAANLSVSPALRDELARIANRFRDVLANQLAEPRTERPLGSGVATLPSGMGMS
jgi:DNA-binding MarR family transcriptional regulator